MQGLPYCVTFTYGVDPQLKMSEIFTVRLNTCDKKDALCEFVKIAVKTDVPPDFDTNDIAIIESFNLINFMVRQFLLNIVNYLNFEFNGYGMTACAKFDALESNPEFMQHFNDILNNIKNNKILINDSENKDPAIGHHFEQYCKEYTSILSTLCTVGVCQNRFQIHRLPSFGSNRTDSLISPNTQ